ncbi:MAG: DUF4190 domain-containing protein [Planctomycetes bacterium]|nr:DUF4190 domain-containing protein [Planctomycetota bacterium]MCH9723731.1 DUF4190 domain-containing protein [Planctomycetota bacterium]MCH9776043.1 DUF4190 domain-containing protein [Planctomycetota bacterium]MDF1745872.1 DUF4190 domain-containing protein [Gimesia sp.]
MSQVLDGSNQSYQNAIDLQDEFSYKPVPPTAVVGLALGLLSFIALFGIIGVGIAVFGIIVSLFSIFSIKRSAGELGGKTVALAAIVLSTFFLITGISYQSFVYAHEVPEGYHRLNFTSDISAKDFVEKDGVSRVNPDVMSWDKKNIFLKGYMYPTRQTKNLKSFILVKDNGQCCFGGQPDAKDMILVEMQDDKSADFYAGLVSVSGEFQAEAPTTAGDLKPVYQLKGTHFEQARTAY